MLDMLKMGLILAIFTVVAAFSLDSVNNITKVKIDENRRIQEENARKEVIVPNSVFFKNILNGSYSQQDKNGKISFDIEVGKDFNNLKLEEISFPITPESLNAIMQFLSSQERVSISEDFLTALKDNVKDENLNLENYFFIMNKILLAISTRVEFVEVINFSFPVVGEPEMQTVDFKFDANNSMYTSLGLNKELKIKKTKKGFIVDSYGDKKDVKEITVPVKFGKGFQSKKVKLEKFRFANFYKAVMKDSNREILFGFVKKVVAKGYAGDPIEIMVGMNKKNLIGIKVLSHKETPGLGSKMLELKDGESTPWFQKQFKGKSLPLKVDKDGGAIASITAATLTSRGVCDGLNKDLKDFFAGLK